MSVKQSMMTRVRRLNARFSKRWKHLAILALVGSSFAEFTGCTAVNNAWRYNGYWNNAMMSQRNKSSASKAWHCRKHHFANHKCLKEFSEGFRAGYMDVADGGTGCTPAFPPREYWGWKYQSCEGQARVSAWFSGYPHGARAAEEDGIGTWSQIQTSARVQQEFSQHGMLNPAAAGIYPIPQAAVPTGNPAATAMGMQTIEQMRGYPVSIQNEPIGVNGVNGSMSNVISVEPVAPPNFIHQ
jgi:hypothetical protein